MSYFALANKFVLSNYFILSSNKFILKSLICDILHIKF